MINAYNRTDTYVYSKQGDLIIAGTAGRSSRRRNDRDLFCDALMLSPFAAFDFKLSGNRYDLVSLARSFMQSFAATAKIRRRRRDTMRFPESRDQRKEITGSTDRYNYICIFFQQHDGPEDLQVQVYLRTASLQSTCIRGFNKALTFMIVQ
jgi:hypothetical protein